MGIKLETSSSCHTSLWGWAEYWGGTDRGNMAFKWYISSGEDTGVPSVWWIKVIKSDPPFKLCLPKFLVTGNNLQLSYLERFISFFFQKVSKWQYLKSVKIVLVMCNFIYFRSGLFYHVCFTFRMAQTISGLSDYKKQQNGLEIPLSSARILQSEKLNFSLSVNMLRIDQVGTLLKMFSHLMI